MTLLLLGVIGVGSAAAQGQNEMASAQARTAQYIFVIDDSGSMSRQISREGPAADPDRLAVFAVRSTLSMLDSVDEATVVRLNGSNDGEQIVPIAPLKQNRKALEDKLSLKGALAEYAGRSTPCADSLAQVKEALNAAYRPNVAQVVMFMTDGACNGTKFSGDSFLKGLKSADDELFKFYLLRFDGRAYTRDLAQLAERTGGMSIVVNAEDPTGILEPFASALSRSQGYESYLLTPKKHELAAHKGARRVRLLAVAPDKGKALEFSIDPARQGDKPKVIGTPNTGVHQFEDGRRYRYAALDYRPGTVPVTVSVKGAGNDWKVVAVPEYRLFVEMKLRSGGCAAKAGRAGASSLSYAEVGSQICAEVRLVNDEGAIVTAAVASRGSEAVVQYQQPGEKSARALPAARQGDEARFHFERSNLVKGDHIIRPIVRLAVPGQKGATIAIKGAAHALQVSSLTIEANPDQVQFGALTPGASEFSELKISGNFPATAGRLVVQNRKDVPECVSFALSGVEEGKTQKITPGQSYKLGVDVAAYCGASSFARDIETAVRIEFRPSDSGLRPPTLVVPVKFSLNNEFAAPRKLSASLKAGDSALMNLKVDGNFKTDAEFNILLPPREQRDAWPSGSNDLELQFLDAAGEPIRNGGEVAQKAKKRFSPGGQGAPLQVRAASDACCAGGVYRTELVLAPTSGTKEPIRVPVEITVEAASMWQCWGSMILWALLALLLILLLLYVYNMFRNSHFLSKKSLVADIELLEWNATGMTSKASDGPRKVRTIVDKGFGFGPRASAWFKANPLKLGLPNDYRYDETVRLMLNPNQAQLTSLKVLDKVGHFEQLKARPRTAAHIFASKNNGFYGVPDEEGFLGAFRYENHMPSLDGELEVASFRNDKLVLEDSERMQGTFAGWEIG
ncbi:vWA domain-containing protein [Bradymonas sediminis]|uniref:vWA domain-containing protein n=1 Tax=Bradymonas sediminis TaxID=1548548 RepID=UPI00105BE6C1|nr:vWA domain-containing protein [Bradymonas sediminis]